MGWVAAHGEVAFVLTPPRPVGQTYLAWRAQPQIMTKFDRALFDEALFEEVRPMLLSLLACGALACGAATGCGGSASETPPPMEPSSNPSAPYAEHRRPSNMPAPQPKQIADPDASADEESSDPSQEAEPSDPAPPE